MSTRLWQPKNNKARCEACSHFCVLVPGAKGRCGVRVNKGGRLHSLVRNKVSVAHMDPVEKKPLYHYRPGTKTFSVGSAGCNFSCPFCQNFEISRSPVDLGTIQGKDVAYESLVREAEKQKARSIAFTYNEPTMSYELIYETAGLAAVQGLDCLLVSNGFQSPECLTGLYRRIRAANIDLKSFREKFYHDLCGARLAPVLENLKSMVQAGWWVEITTLVIPGLNDSDEELRDIARFIRDELGAHVPWHLSRFHGAYRMASHSPTPLPTLERAWCAGREEGLRYVYTGNVSGGLGTATFCPACNAICVERRGYASTVYLNAKEGTCSKCGQVIPGIWA